MLVDAKVNVVGLNVTIGALAAAPVPVRGTLCGLPAALSATLTFAARAPVAVGLNVTLIVQFAFAASVAGLTGQVFVCAKSPAFAPVIETPVIVIAALPEFVSVMVCAALVVPCACDANVNDVGAKLATGAVELLEL
jgi:hypothetical protein